MTVELAMVPEGCVAHVDRFGRSVMAYDVAGPAGPADTMRPRPVHAGKPDSGMLRRLGLIATLIVLSVLGYLVFA
jgi:hypothetical protein